MNDDTKQQIEKLIMAVGSMAELMRLTRDSLMANGFTREEAVLMCTKLMEKMMLSGGRNA